MGKEKEMEKEMESKQMLRFNLVNGYSYILFGDEAIKTYHNMPVSAETCTIKHDDKTITIYLKHIVSIERRGVE